MEFENTQKREDMALHIAQSLLELLDTDAEKSLGIPFSELDPTEFFAATLLAQYYLFRKLTNEGDADIDLVEFTHILNRLAISYTFDRIAKDLGEDTFGKEGADDGSDA